MAIVYLGLGSNLGNRHQNIDKALQLLREGRIKILRTSTIIETEPVGGPIQNKFLNTVVKIETNLSPQELLIAAKEIEKALGRVKTVLNGPRTIDLDILLYDDITIDTPELTIPHPRMFERDFVMRPLKEIAPEIVKKYYARN